MKVIISPRAEKQLKSLGKVIQIVLTKRFRELELGPQLKEEKLSGYRNIYRARAGDYRIIYKRTSVEVYIVLIGHRKEIYHLLRDLLR